MKIIGNGMIAQSFKDYDLGNVCVFACGVSDSTEHDTSKYMKEYELLKNTINENRKEFFIYFSTLSVLKYDYTEYIKHKLFIESYIENHTDNFLILRLPNIIGVTKSKNQLLPFFYNSLMKKDLIHVKTETLRDLIDVVDLPKIIEVLIKNEVKGICNISLKNKIKVIDIINFLIKINKIPNYMVEEIHGSDNIDYDSDIEKYFDELKMKNVNMDPYNIIKKYYLK
jgi:nucleoside-diphosphate-sugar epimerase